MKAFASRVLFVLLMIPVAVLSHGVGWTLWVAATTVSEADIIATEGF